MLLDMYNLGINTLCIYASALSINLQSLIVFILNLQKSHKNGPSCLKGNIVIFKTYLQGLYYNPRAATMFHFNIFILNCNIYILKIIPEHTNLYYSIFDSHNVAKFHNLDVHNSNNSYFYFDPYWHWLIKVHVVEIH